MQNLDLDQLYTQVDLKQGTLAGANTREVRLSNLRGYFFDQHGSYDYAFYVSIGLAFFATLVHLPIDEKPVMRLSTTHTQEV